MKKIAYTFLLFNLGLTGCTTTAQNQRYGSPIPVKVILDKTTATSNP